MVRGVIGGGARQGHGVGVKGHTEVAGVGWAKM